MVINNHHYTEDQAAGRAVSLADMTLVAEADHCAMDLNGNAKNENGYDAFAEEFKKQLRIQKEFECSIHHLEAWAQRLDSLGLSVSTDILNICLEFTANHPKYPRGFTCKVYPDQDALEADLKSSGFMRVSRSDVTGQSGTAALEALAELTGGWAKYFDIPDRMVTKKRHRWGSVKVWEEDGFVLTAGTFLK